MNAEFPPQCDTSDNLNEPFDVDYIEDVFKTMCSLKKKVFSDAEQNISSAQTRMKADYDKKKGKPKVCQVSLHCPLGTLQLCHFIGI